MLAMMGLLIALIIAGSIILFRELMMIQQSMKIMKCDPIPVGENYQCPQCESFWYTVNEEIHFEGCIVPIIKKARSN